MNLAKQLEERLRTHFLPSYFQLINESGKHQSGKDNPQAETHFKLIMVSSHFKGLSLLSRHRQVYTLLDNFLAGHLHALALHLFAPDEDRGDVTTSPPCASGTDALKE